MPPSRDTVLTPLGVAAQVYAGTTAIELQAPLLALAVLLLLVDALLSLWLRGLMTLPRRPAWLGGAAGVLLLIVLIVPSHAQDSLAMEAALDTRLAYVATGLDDVDAMSRAGLTGLGLVLKTRTSYLPEAPLGINLDKDDLSFFPLIYWPMDPREANLSPQALSKLADYMRNGGTLLIDTRDQTLGGGAQQFAGHADPAAPARQARPAAAAAGAARSRADQGVLHPARISRRWEGGKVWVEALPPAEPGAQGPARGGDGVSPIIIGGNDWAAAWAVDSTGQAIAAVSPGGGAARDGVPLRRERGDVRAHGQLQDGSGARSALLERLGK